MDNFNVFLVFPDAATIGAAISNADSLDTYRTTLCDMIDRVDCEPKTNLFYDGSEVSKFISTVSDLVEMEEYLIDDPAIFVYELLINSIDWTDLPIHQITSFYGLWDFDSRQIEQYIPPSVKEAVEYQILESNCVLLNLGFDFQKRKLCVYILKDVSTHGNYQLPIFKKLEQVHDFKAVGNWFQENRTPRQINTTDQRHNEQSTHYIRGKSPLLYDLSRDIMAVHHIQQLLNSAIGDKYDNKDLMNFDPQKGRYIWFENENAINQYHAYHLAKPMSHEEDTVAVTRIPERAKRFIDMQNKL